MNAGPRLLSLPPEEGWGEGAATKLPPNSLRPHPVFGTTRIAAADSNTIAIRRMLNRNKRNALHFTLRGLFIAIGFAAVALTLFKLVRTAQNDALRGSCDGHLSQIAHALLEYKDAHGRLPAAFQKDANGVPMHSWRVLLLPYLGYEKLYSQYDLTEAWNGPNNSRLVANMPDEYKCPASELSKFRTPYFALKSSTDSEIIGVDKTLIVEDALRAVNWMEPTDMNSEELRKDVRENAHELSHHGGELGTVTNECRPFRRQ